MMHHLLGGVRICTHMLQNLSADRGGGTRTCAHRMGERPCMRPRGDLPPQVFLPAQRGNININITMAFSRGPLPPSCPGASFNPFGGHPPLSDIVTLLGRPRRRDPLYGGQVLRAYEGRFVRYDIPPLTGIRERGIPQKTSNKTNKMSTK